MGNSDSLVISVLSMNYTSLLLVSLCSSLRSMSSMIAGDRGIPRLVPSAKGRRVVLSAALIQWRRKASIFLSLGGMDTVVNLLKLGSKA